MNLKCPLCQSPESEAIQHLNRPEVRFRDCANCKLIFIEPEFLLSADMEKARYQTHNNSRDNPGYVSLFDPIRSWFKEHLSKEDSILDYGCGPGPVLAELLQEDGFRVDLYDPHFFPAENIFTKKYKAITCTEAIEHFYKPKEELDRILEILSENGILVIQTQFAKDAKHFESWWYARDPTHVSFFRLETFKWLAQNKGLQIDSVMPSQINLRK